jgi:large subunit ribosomal protein L10
MTELRKRLFKVGAEIHVVKNSIFRIAAKQTGVADLTGSLAGMMAVVTGPKDVSSAAKVLKTFASEFEKPKIKFGYLASKRMELAEIVALADLPPIEILRGKLLGVLKAPGTKLVQLLNTPATQLARVLQAKVQKG